MSATETGEEVDRETGDGIGIMSTPKDSAKSKPAAGKAAPAGKPGAKPPAKGAAKPGPAAKKGGKPLPAPAPKAVAHAHAPGGGDSRGSGRRIGQVLVDLGFIDE